MTIKKVKSGEYALTAILNEHTKLDKIKKSKSNPIYIDLDGLVHINSLGFRALGDLLKCMEKKKKRLIFKNAPVSFIIAMSPMREISSRIELESLYIPLFCKDCYVESQQLISIKDAEICKNCYKSQMEKNIDELLVCLDCTFKFTKCVGCHKKMTFDDEVGAFFYFMELYAGK